ncbi:hypothetical protein RFI_40023 [Reticulomyxa filosa]|uniref:Transmembrane protein n=1 Tax=Reticulomyxa filosa TaxID=46433 RepID=X6L8T5_RETFI|nr:hypothetical protein RFI_40023 [Reticulomyxa filosa]|eukprot:ETN97506.1 hypothetical protein RFI_40023 [Reticulomyxa filosa]
MGLNAQKLGFHSERGLIIVFAVNSLFGVYCLWLLHVIWRKMWNVARERVASEMAVEIQRSTVTRKGTAETSVSVSLPEKKVERPTVIDVRIKWIVTLYTLGCFLTCIGNVCEPLTYALVDSPGEACARGLYVVYLRVFMEGLFYSFYVMRTIVLLQGSVFEISKRKQYFFGIAPIITFCIVLFAHNLRLQLSGCDSTSMDELLVDAVAISAQIFWNITLFLFLVYHVHKVANMKLMENNQCQKNLKSYLQKLLRLFLIAEAAETVFYVVVFVPSWSDALWPAANFDLCVNSSTMILSFAFAKSFFDTFFVCPLYCSFIYIEFFLKKQYSKTDLMRYEAMSSFFFLVHFWEKKNWLNIVHCFDLKWLVIFNYQFNL